MKFVSRNEWGARSPKGRAGIGATRGVTLHWEGPHMGSFPHRECDNKVRQIQDFHMDGRDWSDIAYNALVCPHGYVYEGRGVKIRSAANGTSNIGGNDAWYAVCYLGGQRDDFTDDGKDAFKDAVDWLRRKGDAGSRVNGHRDHHATECPGDEIYRWLRNTNWHDLGGDDMPSAQEVAEAVWKYNIPSGHKDNPEWLAQNFVRNIETDVDMTLSLLRKVAEQVGAPVQVDESELARQILTGLADMPDRVADLVVDSVGPEVAARVVDELGQRINQ